MLQTNKDIVCHYCKKNTGANKGNKFHWNGFKDGDMNIFVCWGCRDAHYKAKQKTKYQYLYTEFPVPIFI
jgi:hypothetical protein